MSSQQANHQARWRDRSRGPSKLRQLILFLLPITDLKRNREALVETYAHFYEEIEVAREKLSDLSNEEIRIQARRAAQYAPDYDPHPINTKISKILEWLGTLWTALSYLFMLVGTALSLQQLVVIARNIQQFPDLFLGLLPPILVALVGSGMYLLRADTFVHQTVNSELRVEEGRLCTRDRSKLVGYKIWNHGLHGQRGLLLLVILYCLESLQYFPLIGRFFSNPRKTVLTIIQNHAETLYHADGVLDAIIEVVSEITEERQLYNAVF